MRSPNVLKASSFAEVECRVKDLGYQGEKTNIPLCTEADYAEGDTFLSYHYKALKLLSEEALLAGFLMIWLKKCVVSMHPHDVILATVAFPAYNS